MRGEQPAVSVRVTPRGLRRSWSAYLAELKHRRARRRREQLELIERIGREQRRIRRSGEFVAGGHPRRRWF